MTDALSVGLQRLIKGFRVSTSWSHAWHLIDGTLEDRPYRPIDAALVGITRRADRGPEMLGGKSWLCLHCGYQEAESATNIVTLLLLSTSLSKLGAKHRIGSKSTCAEHDRLAQSSSRTVCVMKRFSSIGLLLVLVAISSGPPVIAATLDKPGWRQPEHIARQQNNAVQQRHRQRTLERQQAQQRDQLQNRQQAQQERLQRQQQQQRDQLKLQQHSLSPTLQQRSQQGTLHYQQKQRRNELKLQQRGQQQRLRHQQRHQRRQHE